MHVITILILLFAVGCEPSERSLSPAAPAMPPPPSAAPSASTSASTTAADRVLLLQKVIELDRLKPFWHPEVEGRIPLQVFKGGAVADAPPLSLLGSPVVYVEDRASRPFELTSIELSAVRARVEFRYPREGVFGHAVFERSAKGWLIVEQEVNER